VLLKGGRPSAWHVEDPAGNSEVTYHWRGYRLEDGHVVLLHELELQDGSMVQIQERPEAVLSGARMSLQRRFNVQGLPADVNIVNRMRMAGPDGRILPARTDGLLLLSRTDDETLADLVLETDGSTWISVPFKGHWVDSASSRKESSQ